MVTESKQQKKLNLLLDILLLSAITLFLVVSLVIVTGCTSLSHDSRLESPGTGGQQETLCLKHGYGRPAVIVPIS